jgi:hypothetical protein
MTNMRLLLALKQSVWLDYLSRGMTRSGELHMMIADGLRGMTSNPTIFEHAIAHTSDYDQDLTALAHSGRSDQDIFETLAIEDVREAADVFRAVFDSTKSGDGFVSLEVSPKLARNTDGSVTEARRLWKALDRPNVMIKIPGTREGWPAIERCLAEGININITLLFSVEHYAAVAEAYLRALEARGSRAADRPHRVGCVVLRQSRRHRGRRTDPPAWWLADRPARQGRPRKRAAGLCRLSGDDTHRSMASLGGEGRPHRSACFGPAPGPRTRSTRTSSMWTL